WLTAAAVVAIRAPILSGGGRRRLQLCERRQRDSRLLEGLADRPRDRRCVRRVAMDADALDPQLERAALDGVDRPVPDESERTLGRPLRAAQLLHTPQPQPP